MWCLQSPMHRRGTCFRIPFFQTGSLFSSSSVEAARSAARDLSLFTPHLESSSSATPSRRSGYSGSAAPRAPSRPLAAYSSSQRSSSPHRPQPGKKGTSRFRKKSSGPHQKRVSFRRWEPCPSSAIGGCLANFWLAWRAWGVDSWVVEVLRVGCQIPFDRRPPLSECPLSLPASSPQSIRGVALHQELQFSKRGRSNQPPQSPGFYSRLFLVQKASGSWRPIIELSTLNDYVTSFHFHLETPVSPSLHPSRRLDDLPGSAGRLPAGSCSSRFASLPSVRGARTDIPVQGPLFRSDDCAPSFLEDYGSGFPHPSQVWGQDASFPGRLAHPGIFGASLFTVEGQAPDSRYRTWHPGRPHEIVSSSHSITSVSRHGDSVSAFLSSTLSSSGRQSASSDRGVPVHPVSPSVPLASASGPPVVPHAPRPPVKCSG